MTENVGGSTSSISKSSPYLVGKNSHGNWVVRDQTGLRGGLFVNRAEALKFAMFENGHDPQAVIMVPGTLELDFATDATIVHLATRPRPQHGIAPIAEQRPIQTLRQHLARLWDGSAKPGHGVLRTSPN